jgi:hypothetical protein
MFLILAVGPAERPPEARESATDDTDNGSSLDVRGTYELRGAACRDTQKAREATEVAGGGGACSLTTVQWGTTFFKCISIIVSFLTRLFCIVRVRAI